MFLRFRIFLYIPLCGFFQITLSMASLNDSTIDNLIKSYSASKNIICTISDNFCQIKDIRSYMDYPVTTLTNTLHSIASPDTNNSSSPDTSLLWIDRSDYLVAGVGLENRELNVIFKNNTANFIGTISSSPLPTEWKFTPTLNQLNLSIFLVSRLGALAFHKGLNPSGNSDVTKLSSLNFSRSFGKINFTLNYLKYKGLVRTEPIQNSELFLPDIIFRPLTLIAEYHLIGKLRGHVLYTPKRGMGDVSIGGGFSSLLIRNNSDFIPGVQDTGSVISINNTYLNKFESYGLAIPLKAEYLILLFQRGSGLKYKTLYLKFGIHYLLNFQYFKYNSMTSSFSNTQFEKYQKGKGVTWSLLESGSVVYDAGQFYFGISANYYNYSYGYANDGIINANLGPIPFEFKVTGTSKSSGIEANNHVEDIRATYSFYFGYRIPFRKQYAKINSATNRLKFKLKSL